MFFPHVVRSDLLGVALVLARNGLLVAASLLAARSLWRDTVSEPAPDLPAPAARTDRSLTSS